MGLVMASSGQSTPSPDGCVLVTPPPGSLWAVNCNWDRQEAQLSQILTQIDSHVLIPIAVGLLALGLFSLATGRAPLPGIVARRLRRVPSSARDRRQLGLSVALVACGALVMLGSSVTSPQSPFPLTPLSIIANCLCLGTALVINLRVRFLDRRTSQITSSWDQFMSGFSPWTRSATRSRAWAGFFFILAVALWLTTPLVASLTPDPTSPLVPYLQLLLAVVSLVAGLWFLVHRSKT